MDNLDIKNESENRLVRVIGETPEVINGKEYKNSNVIVFEGVEYIISHKATLTINVTDKCSACCSFCSNGISFMPAGFVDPNESSLGRITDFAVLAGINVIAYTGGEPTLKPQALYDLVLKTLPRFKEGRLHTNGNCLFNEITTVTGSKAKLIDSLIELGLFGCSLSLAHQNPETNSEIMRFNGNYKGLDDNQLSELAGMRSPNFSPRLSCIINSKGVKTNEDILGYIESGERLGFKSFIFRSGTGIPTVFDKQIGFGQSSKEVSLDIDSSASFFAGKGFDQIFRLKKSDADLCIVRKNDVTAIFDKSSEEIDPDDKVRRLIYMPNGVSYSSWIDPSSLIFHDEIGKVIDKSISGKGKSDSGFYPAGKPSIYISSRMAAVGKDTAYADLHTHSIDSDGKLSVREIILEARERGVAALAITEHNFMQPDYEMAKKDAAALGVEIPFPGTEINTVYIGEDGQPERIFHILGYGDGLMDEEFQQFIQKPLNLKNDYYRDLIEKLKVSPGFNFPTFEEMLMGINKNGRPRHPNKRLMSRSVIAGYIAECVEEKMSLDEIKAKYLPLIPQKTSYSDFLDAKVVVGRIRDLGGIAGIAHPGCDRPFNKCAKDIRQIMRAIFVLRKAGMQGVESFSKHHSSEEQAAFYRFANDLGMLTVGGSDYHGKPGQVLAKQGLTREDTDRMKELLYK